VTPVVVLDVNILASAAVSRHGLPREVLRAGLRRQYILVTSPHILKKLADTFSKQYFVDHLRPEDRDAFIGMVVRRSQRCDPDPSVRDVAADIEDDLVLGTAVAAGADFLVTGDKALVAVSEHLGVRIVTAAQFLVEAGLA